MTTGCDEIRSKLFLFNYEIFIEFTHLNQTVKTFYRRFVSMSGGVSKNTTPETRMEINIERIVG